ncbi:MAG: hypothetical protein AVDCRST_MAG48-2936, partial [uncultured Friedmanniella sp.]
ARRSPRAGRRGGPDLQLEPDRVVVAPGPPPPRPGGLRSPASPRWWPPCPGGGPPPHPHHGDHVRVGRLDLDSDGAGPDARGAGAGPV